jgi:hypothetical protein
VPEGSARRALSAGAVLLALLAIVALASRGHLAGAGGGGTRRIETGPVIEYVLLVLIVLALVELPLIAIGVLKSKDDPDMLPKRGNWQLRVFVSMTLFAVAALGFAYWRRSHHHTSGVGKPPPQGFAPQVKKPHLSGTQPVAFDWAPVIVVLSIAAVGAAIGIAYFLRARKARKPLEARAVEALRTALDESLDDLRRERDARRAVIAAYARMEKALAVGGLPRHPAEAPLEYLARVLRDLLRASAASVARLTALFERAKFSTHEIGPDLKEEAIEALIAVRDEVRAYS